MKNLFQKITIFACAVAITAATIIVPVKTEAATSSQPQVKTLIKQAYTNKSATIKKDMDGNGKADQVTVSVYADMDEEKITKVELKIKTDKGKTATNCIKSLSGVGCTVQYVELSAKDRFICLTDCSYYGEELSQHCNLYKFDSSTGKFKYVKNVDIYTDEYNYAECHLIKATASAIVVKYKALSAVSGSLSVNLTWNYTNGNFKLKSAIGTAKSYDMDNNKFKTAMQLSFYKAYNSKTKAFTVAKNKSVMLLKILVKNNVLYGQFKYGSKTGWLNITPSKYKKYFAGINYAL